MRPPGDDERDDRRRQEHREAQSPAPDEIQSQNNRHSNPEETLDRGNPEAEQPFPPREGASEEGPTRKAQRRRRQTRSGMSGIRSKKATRVESKSPPPPRRQPPPSTKDPVQEAFDDSVDLYEIARWEVRTPLDAFAVRLTNALEESKRWILLSVAVSLFIGQFVVAAALIIEVPFLGILGLISVAPALALAGYFWYGDPTTKEPLVTLAITFLLAVGFASIAGIANSLLLPVFELFGIFGLTVAYFIVVGPVEETVKWLAVRVHAYRTDAFQTVVDGVVYGAMAGVGFAAIENLLYILLFSVEMTTAGIIVQETEAVSIATQRAFVGPGHVIFSAWAGFYLGLAKFNQSKRGPIVVKGLLIAAFIHALYNTLVTTLPLSMTSFVAFIIVFHGFWFALLYRKISAYRDLYRQRHHPR